MPRISVISTREFMKWAALGTGAVALGTIGVAPIRQVNAVLLADGAKSSGCRKDVCRTEDAPDSTCEKRDVCDVDRSGHCRVDECESDTSGGCSNDGCVADRSRDCAADSCASDSSGECAHDACEIDSSGECDGDACASDSSGGCTNDDCASDKSGNCTIDDCVSDKSGDCGVDVCVSDSSKSCETDACESDSSGACLEDACAGDSSGACSGDDCATDASGGCDADACTLDSSGSCIRDTCGDDSSGASESGVQECETDRSGACIEDRCVSDYSGACTRDVCVQDESGACDTDLCRVDESPVPCSVRDACATDVAMGAPLSRRALACTGFGRAVRWLYDIAVVAFVAAALAPSARADSVIDASNAVFSPDPTIATAQPVAVAGTGGAFLRDADGDGVLEADTNGDGLADGDPEVKDWDGDGTRELPPGTPFTGTFEFSCFYVPSDVRIETTGPLTIRASREVAVFGTMWLASGASISTPGPIDLWTSAWLSADGAAISFTTARAGDVARAKSSRPKGSPPGPVTFTQVCDFTTPALRAVSPPAGTVGTGVTVRGALLGTKKGRVRIGKAKLKLIAWLPERVTCLVRSVPRRGPRVLDVLVQPKGAKSAASLTFPAAFEVRPPEVLYASRDEAPIGAQVQVAGAFLGTRRGKVTVGKRVAKVVAWSMDNATGRSIVRFVVPERLAAATQFPVTLRTTMGSATFNLKVLGPVTVAQD